jgi:hypothetical protein
MDTDTAPAPGIAIDNKTTDDNVVVRGGEPPSREIEMEVDDGIGTHEDSKDAAAEQEKKEEPTPMQADDDDAVEY